MGLILTHHTSAQPQSSRGFTIIEIVLVLAIAGLIFLMVFFAFPTIQRNQRDSQRQSNISRVLASMTQYRINNRNVLPQSADALNTTFLNNYLQSGGDEFVDPLGKPYVFVLDTDTGTGAIESDFGEGSEEVRIWYYPNAKCSGDTLEVLGSPTAPGASIALRMRSEGQGIICRSES